MPAVLKKSKLVQLKLPPLHQRQAEFVNDSHRIVVAACGSKTGKTFGLCIWLLREAWNRNQSINWWTAPTLRQARIAFNTICRWLPPQESGRVRVNRNEMVITLLNTDGSVHSTIEFRSADNPDSLRGEGVHAAVIDEAGYWSEASFVSVMTTLTRTKGKLRIISTPKGRTWFYFQWIKGWLPEERKKNPEYMSYQLPTTANPYIDRDMIAQFKKNMPEDVFRQEILAEFLSDGAGVFRHVSDCEQSRLVEKPVSGRRYVIGVDFAKHEDFTVLTVCDTATRSVVHMKRYNDVDWNLNVQRCVQTAREWNSASLWIDSTGVGDVPFDLIRSVYPNVTGYNIFNNAEKTALIQSLQVAFEKNEIKIPKAADQSTEEYRALAEVLRHELSVYSYEMSGQGKFLYSAPEGMHDDCVMSLALANWAMSDTPYVIRVKQVPGV